MNLLGSSSIVLSNFQSYDDAAPEGVKDKNFVLQLSLQNAMSS
jgi:hypothetical protein